MGLAVLLWYLNLVAGAWVIDEVYPPSEYPTKEGLAAENWREWEGNEDPRRKARAWLIWGAFLFVVIEVWFFLFILRIVKPRDPAKD